MKISVNIMPLKKNPSTLIISSHQQNLHGNCENFSGGSETGVEHVKYTISVTAFSSVKYKAIWLSCEIYTYIKFRLIAIRNEAFLPEILYGDALQPAYKIYMKHF
jgi:hypothetical protein